MELKAIEGKVNNKLYAVLRKDIKELRPAQAKAVDKGLLDGNSLLVCTPTASGKTLIAELAALNSILEARGKAVYVVPLKALAREKYNEFTRKYPMINVGLSVGDVDEKQPGIAGLDLVVTTSEKLDSLIRHRTSWLRDVIVVIVDEVHLLNDPSRGPTLEILITILRRMLKNIQIIALSATIGNPEELASWLDAGLVVDDWRPVRLRQGVYLDGEIEFSDEDKKK